MGERVYQSEAVEAIVGCFCVGSALETLVRADRSKWKYYESFHQNVEVAAPPYVLENGGNMSKVG